MRNIWKGLIVGGLTGAGAGAVLDVLNKSARLVGTTTKRAAEMAPDAAERVRSAATSAGRKAADIAPEAAERLRDAVNTGVARVQEAELGEHLRHQAHELAHRVGDSDPGDYARQALDRATSKGRHLAHSVKDSAPVRSRG